MQNYKKYAIPPAQLIIADVPYNVGKNFYGSNPMWYNGGDNKNGESKLAGGCKFSATVHSFRKTFASREYRRTKDVLFVSKRLGHSSTDVTIKYYICDDIELDRMQANLAA